MAPSLEDPCPEGTRLHLCGLLKIAPPPGIAGGSRGGGGWRSPQVDRHVHDLSWVRMLISHSSLPFFLFLALFSYSIFFCYSLLSPIILPLLILCTIISFNASDNHSLCKKKKILLNVTKYIMSSFFVILKSADYLLICYSPSLYPFFSFSSSIFHSSFSS